MSYKSLEIEHLRHLIHSRNTFVLATHVHPDGDAIGAIQAFATFLRVLGKRVYVMVPNAYPDFLAFLDRSKEDKILIYKYKQKFCTLALREADAVICLDVNALNRMYALGEEIASLSIPKVVIDHHPDPVLNDFDLTFSDSEMSSTCEVVYRVICALEMVSPFPVGAVEPLYVGIMTDTNNFFHTVSAGTFEVAAQLLRLGASKEEIQQRVFGAFTEKRMRFMAHAVYNRMVLVRPYRAAYMTLSLVEQEQFGFRPGDSEGFVNIPMNIKEVDVSMLFVETPDYIRVSLRSRNGVDVNEMGKRFFNGGGHKQASGGRLFCTFAELPGIIMQALFESEAPKEQGQTMSELVNQSVNS